MSLTDVFNGDAFTLLSLTTAINQLPYKPSRIGEMGLFANKGIKTTTAVVEERAGLLALLPAQNRGGPGTVGTAPKRTVRSFVVPHVPHTDYINADDVQDVRELGSEDTLQSVAKIVNDRMALMRQNHEVTLEHLRIGALQGNILDADGSTVLFNLFTEFGVSEVTQDFAFTTGSTEIRGLILTVKRAIEDALGAAPYDHIHCFCGPTWFDAFIDHDNVKTAYERWQEGAFLRSDPRAGFPFADVIFEEYRGTVSGVEFLSATQARFFPVGTPNLFRTILAPADYMETVNTIGKEVYAKQVVTEFQTGVKLQTQSNPLPMCMYPAALVKATQS